MKKFFMFFAVIIVFIIGTVAISSKNNNLVGYVVSISNEPTHYGLYFLIGFLIIASAILSYIYGVRKFGPA